MVNSLKFLFFSLLLIASKSFAGPANSLFALNETPSWTFQTPINFAVAVAGSDFLSTSWVQPGPPPPFYNLKTFEVATGNLIVNETFPNTGPNHTTSGLLGGVNYVMYLYPLAANGLPDAPPAVAFGETIIIDLVVVKFDADGNLGNICNFPADQECPFSPIINEYAQFKVMKPAQQGSTKYFRITKLADKHYQMEINTLDGFQFLCNGTTIPTPRCEAFNNIVIRDNDGINGGTLVATLRVGQPMVSGDPFLALKGSIRIGYSIDQNSYNIGSDEPDERIDEGSPLSQQLSASPNPFNAQIDIYIPYAKSSQPTNVTLNDLQGSLVKSESFPGDQQINTLATNGLLPGLYLLRVKTGDKTETARVMKTQ